MLVIVIQTFARRRLAARLVNSMQQELLYVSARKKMIQATWPGYNALSFCRQYNASRKFQAVWRGYNGFTRYLWHVSSRKMQAAWRVCVDLTRYRQYVA
jgi:hypothetical protein